jgi:hypothetical protein
MFRSYDHLQLTHATGCKSSEFSYISFQSCKALSETPCKSRRPISALRSSQSTGGVSSLSEVCTALITSGCRVPYTSIISTPSFGSIIQGKIFRGYDRIICYRSLCHMVRYLAGLGLQTGGGDTIARYITTHHSHYWCTI